MSRPLPEKVDVKPIGSIDDVVSILNPCKAVDLRSILSVVPGHDRPRMALAFVCLTPQQWLAHAGIANGEVNFSRWIGKRSSRMPLWAAARLAKVFNQVVEELFIDWL